MITEMDLRMLYKQETGKDCVTHFPNECLQDALQDIEYYEWVQEKLLGYMNKYSAMDVILEKINNKYSEKVNKPYQSTFDRQMEALDKMKVKNPLDEAKVTYK